ncbi:MAG: DUF952 domain-containing protein [Myxococcota bacterium]|nr:DUF952 domain-containing protein [Myxococcota bacterium]
MLHLLHIAARSDWEAARAAGRYEADSLASEGFIHCSTAAQVVRVADERFAGRRDLVLLCIDPARTGAPLRWENCEGGDEDFPHLYGALPTAAVVAALPFAAGPDGRFALPELP